MEEAIQARLRRTATGLLAWNKGCCSEEGCAGEVLDSARVGDAHG